MQQMMYDVILISNQNTAQVEIPLLTIHLSFDHTILSYRSNRNFH